MIDKTVAVVSEGLKNQPLALALVVINVMFLVTGGWLLLNVSDRVKAGNERHDALIERLLDECVRKQS